MLDTMLDIAGCVFFLYALALVAIQCARLFSIKFCKSAGFPRKKIPTAETDDAISAPAPGNSPSPRILKISLKQVEQAVTAEVCIRDLFLGRLPAMDRPLLTIFHKRLLATGAAAWLVGIHPRLIHAPSFFSCQGLLFWAVFLVAVSMAVQTVAEYRSRMTDRYLSMMFKKLSQPAGRPSNR